MESVCLYKGSEILWRRILILWQQFAIIHLFLFTALTSSLFLFFTIYIYIFTQVGHQLVHPFLDIGLCYLFPSFPVKGCLMPQNSNFPFNFVTPMGYLSTTSSFCPYQGGGPFSYDLISIFSPPHQVTSIFHFHHFYQIPHISCIYFFFLISKILTLSRNLMFRMLLTILIWVAFSSDAN